MNFHANAVVECEAGARSGMAHPHTSEGAPASESDLGCEWAFVPCSLCLGAGGMKMGLDKHSGEGRSLQISPCPALRLRSLKADGVPEWILPLAPGDATPSDQGLEQRAWPGALVPRHRQAGMGCGTCLWSITALLAASPCPGVCPCCIPALSSTWSRWGVWG